MSIDGILRPTQCLTLPSCGQCLHCPVCLLSQMSSCVLDLESSVLYPNNGSQLEIDLVNLAVPALPRIPCDVYPVFVDLPVVTCQTRYTSLEHSTWQDEWASLFSVALGDMTPTVPTKIRRGFKILYTNILTCFQNSFPLVSLGVDNRSKVLSMAEKTNERK